SKFKMTTSLSTAAPVSPVTAGVPVAITVTALFGDSSPDTGYQGTVHFASSDPAATLPVDYAFTAADNGVHTFVATFKTAGSQSLSVTDTADSSISSQAVMTAEFALLTPNSHPWVVTNGPDGNLWFTEYGSNRIGRITPDGGVAEFQGLTGSSGPIGITAGP